MILELRPLLDRRLTVRDDEVAITPEGRELVYSGRSPSGTRVADVSAIKLSRHATSYRVEARREDFYRHPYYSGGDIKDREFSERPAAVDEFLNPKALQRASRVERTARRIEAGIAVTVTAVAVAGGFVALAETNQFATQPPATTCNSSNPNGASTPFDTATRASEGLAGDDNQGSGDLIHQLPVLDPLAIGAVVLPVLSA